MSEAITYRIKTARDFLQVPEGRRAQCLKEFALWLDHASQMQPAIEALQSLGALRNDPLENFIWRDDGELVAHVRLSVNGEKVGTFSFPLDKAES